MPSESKNREGWHQQIENVLDSLTSYFITLWTLLRNPRAQLSYLLSSDKKPYKAISPYTFLITNIVIVLTVEEIFGYSIPEFPLPEFLHQLPWIPKFPFSVIPYLLGGLVISTLLLFFVSRSDFPHEIKRVAPVVCYASVVYLPFSLIEMLAPNIFDTFWLSISNRQLPPSSSSFLIEFLAFVSFYCLGVMWWLYLLHLGMQSVNLQFLYNGRTETLAFAAVSYLGIKLAVYLLMGTFYMAQLLAAKNQLEELKGAIMADPPNYSACHLLAIKVSANDLLPIFYRYKASMMAAGCLPAVFLPEERDSKALKQVIEAIRNSDHRTTRENLEGYFTELGKNKTSGYPSIHKMGSDFLKQADEFYKSPQFVEYKGEVTIGIISSDTLIALFP
ncbi:MAG: hypothetical protein MCM46_16300 [Candidatus Manganitrophus sp. SB1]|nr:hypothetical protein [Candidatus Manganitrophus morganii]